MRSLRLATSRQIPKPNDAESPLKRSWLNGSRNSATHPSESTAAAPSHTPSHVMSSM